MRASLGQPVIIENVAGAAGSIGVGRVARAAPDGYTLGHRPLGHPCHQRRDLSLPYDLLKDFEPVALIATQPRADRRQEGHAGERPEGSHRLAEGQSRQGIGGTAGVGGPSACQRHSFQKLTGTRFRFVPYRGIAPAMQDLVAGQIDLMIDQAPTTSCRRCAPARSRPMRSRPSAGWPAAPDIPTVDEAGLPGFLRLDLARALGAEGHAEGAIAKLNAAVVDALADPAVRSGSPSRPGDSAARAADAGGARAPPEGRDREVVADHQGGRTSRRSDRHFASGPFPLRCRPDKVQPSCP